MLIEIAKHSGFCFGVERAIELTEKAAEQYGSVNTLGPLIHNKTVTDALEKKGVYIAETPEQAAGKPLVIRSHGVTAETERRVREMCPAVIDATCPFVAKIHRIAAAQPSDGVLIVLGDEKHPEVQGIMGHASCRVYACMGYEDIERLFSEGKLSDTDKISLVVQTTFDAGRFSECQKQLSEKHRRIEIYKTICNATSERQKNAEELAKRAAIMIVIGGRSSSNTAKLAEICARRCKTVFVENAADLNKQELLKDLRSDAVIGITAGASTPAYTIKEIFTTMSEEIKNAIDEEDFAALLEQDQSFNKLYTNKRVKATVVSISKKEAVVEVGAKQTGYILRDELTNDPNAEVADVVSVGDVIDAVVIKVDDSVGTAFLSKKRVDAALGLEKMKALLDSNETVEGTVTQVIKGGVIVFYNGVRVFIPASHTGVPRGGKLEELLKQTVKFKIIEVTDQRGGRVVGSIRNVSKESRDAERAAFWESVQVGQKFEGVVRSIADYGVFVSIGPVDGLVRTAELTWNRVGHPKDIVQVGDKLNVIVKSIDLDKKKVSLSAKDPDENPWTKFVAEYHKGDVIKATIVSITEFGAFAQIIPGVDGLIHISQISTERVTNIASVLTVGQEVDVKIIDIEEDKNRVSLSIKALMEEAAPAEADAE